MLGIGWGTYSGTFSHGWPQGKGAEKADLKLLKLLILLVLSDEPKHSSLLKLQQRRYL